MTPLDAKPSLGLLQGRGFPANKNHFLGPLKAHFLAAWLAHQAKDGENPLLLPAATPLLLSEGAGMSGWGAKAFSASFQQLRNSLCWDAGSGLCLPLGHVFFIRDFPLL